MKRIEMGHAGHFIGGNDCRFHRNTYVNGYIVSTVGEYLPPGAKDLEFQQLGLGRLYETMVFGAEKSNEGCCPYRQTSGHCFDFAPYNTATDAQVGHEAMVKRWGKKRGKKRLELES